MVAVTIGPLERQAYTIFCVEEEDNVACKFYTNHFVTSVIQHQQGELFMTITLESRSSN
jgi:hypothetical protein